MVDRITSLDDPRLAPYRHVADPAWLRAHDLFVAEGRLVVERLLRLPRYTVHSVVVTPAAWEALRAPLSATAADVYVCDLTVVNGITGFNFHRGCVALASRPDSTPLERVMSSRLLLGLEGVGNPDNIGGLFRAAAAFGAGGVLLDATSGDPLYRKAIRTSMGAALQLPFVRAADWLEALRTLQRQAFRIAALTPDPSAPPIDSAAASAGERLVLLVGAEGGGLSGDTLALADVRLRIPIAPSVDSLNVVVAAGIALHMISSTRS
jgi:tRNA G18 (ribose-2'-O)-methylase SpoU